jgi:hypothetical protein
MYERCKLSRRPHRHCTVLGAFRLCFWTSSAQPQVAPSSPSGTVERLQATSIHYPSGSVLFYSRLVPHLFPPKAPIFLWPNFQHYLFCLSFLVQIIGPLCRIPSQLASHDIPVLSFAESEPPAMNAESTRVIFPPTRYTFPCF